MNIRKMTIEDMCFTTEKQEFDRKSARIDATAIATPIIAFANADGGLLAIGIEDNGKITGIDDYLPNINEILRAPFDFCVPTIRIETQTLQIVEQSIDFVRDQIKEHTYLGKDGKFVTDSEYPEFAWKEIIVNAIAHRDYSIKGTDIQIKMFDDHFTVESPGTLPGIVRINNMRQVHFSRNPKIAEVLHEYEYVREYGEGIDRLYNEMEKAGLPSPEYYMEAFMLHATLKNRKYVEHVIDATQVATQVTTQVTTQVSISEKITAYCKEPRKKSEIMAYCGYKNAKSFTKKYLKPLMDQGLITMMIPDKPNSQNQRYIASRR